MAPPNIGINVKLIFLITAFGIITLFGVIFPGVHALYNEVTRVQAEETVYRRPIMELREHQVGEREYLVRYGWVDEQRGIATIPLENDPQRPGDEFNAMEQYVEQLRNRQRQE